ncbi:hypothetical protein CRUP_000230 [Coryphaenoides rupestris]|nr:hypothetical protein CRUP_000230 [Coryphaenoides rupestris]
MQQELLRLGNLIGLVTGGAPGEGGWLPTTQRSSLATCPPQQKLAMQQELLRLGNLIGLVTEVLQEKEVGSTTTTELPGHLPSTGHDLPMPCDQEVEQTTSDPAPIKRSDSVGPHSSVANRVEATPPCPLKHGNAAETVPQSSMATRRRARLSGNTGTPSSVGSVFKSTKVKSKPPASPSPSPPPPPGLETIETIETVGGGQVMVKTFAKRIGARLVPQGTPGGEPTSFMCTDDSLVCERTLKYFLGIAGRKWVVSFLWISECFRRGQLLDEVRGDVVNGPHHQGPLRARSTGDQDLLMKGYKICFQGSFTDMTTGNPYQTNRMAAAQTRLD